MIAGALSPSDTPRSITQAGLSDTIKRNYNRSATIERTNLIEIFDLRDCERSGLFYGGRAGQKEGILIDGEPWIAKYPRTTRDLQGEHLPPYTSSPISTEGGKSRAIHPFEYLTTTHNPDLDAALVRFVEKVDLDAIHALVDDIPAEAYGHPLMPESMRTSHKLLLEYRLNEGFMPAYRQIKER